MELDWAAESEFGVIQWAAFLHGTNISQGDVTSGHRVVLTYTLSWTSRCIGKGPGILPILDVTPHPWYRALEAAVSKTEPTEELTLGFTCTGTHSYPIIRRSPSASDSLRHVLMGADLLVYHILTRLTGSACTHVVLAPGLPRNSTRVRPRIVIPDSEGEEDDEIDDDVQDANELIPAGLTLASIPEVAAPDALGDDVRWLNHSPWMPEAGPSWQRAMVEVEPGEEEGVGGVEVYLGLTVIVATLAPREEEHHPAVTAEEKRKRPPDDSCKSLAAGDEGYVDLNDFKRARHDGDYSQCTTRSSQCTTSSE